MDRLFFLFHRTWLLAVIAVTAGCADSSGGGPMYFDAETWDVRLIDAGPPVDAGGRDAAAAADGALPDAGSVPACPMEVCDPRERGGCPDAACVLGADGTAVCGTAGVGEAGSPCMTTAECAPGFACFADSTGTRCSRLCCPGDASSCMTGLRCDSSGTLADGTPTAWGHCAPPRTCNVLDSEGTCEPGEGCYIVDGEGHTECRTAGHSGQGDTCTDADDCEPGFFCGGLRVRVCSRICALEGMPACPEAEGRCVAYAYSPEGTGTCTAGM